MERRSILVTGGSGGIGRAIVEALLADDEKRAVAFTYHSNRDAAREIEERSAGRARAFAFALADRRRPEDLVGEVEEEVGAVDGLVNNAGLRREGLLALTPDSTWDEVVDANLGSAFRTCRAVLRGMVARRRGSIVNLSSLSARHGLAGDAAYAAAKAGLLAMTRVLAREVGRRGVRVNAVMPGFVPTAMTAELPAARVESLTAGQCLPGGVTAADVADAVVFLLSERARAITGQTLVVDAGTSA